jgi:hypothetical protein
MGMPRSERVWGIYLDHVDGREVAMEAMEAPGGERELQQPDQPIDAVVDGHHAPEVGRSKEAPKDGEVGRVQEEAPRAPDYQRHYLHSGAEPD